MALIASALLAAAPGSSPTFAAQATPRGMNGQIAFRRYLDNERRTGALFRVNPDGSGVARLTRPPRGVVDQFEDWAPDGRKLVFERKLPCPAGGPRDGLDGTCDLIYVVRRGGTGLKPLVPCDFDVSKPFPGTCVGARTPSWSPDGTEIAFRYALVDQHYVDSFHTNIGIWIVGADGSGRRQVTQLTPGSSWDREPQWSPDGTKLAFVRDDLVRRAEATFTVNVDGTGLFQVTPWALNAGGRPDWSPDAKWIIVTAGPGDGSENVYKIHPDGTGLVNLTRQRAAGYHYLTSTFSPDGKWIVSARTPGAGLNGHADLVLMRPNGSGLHRIVKTPFWESSVDWGPRPTR